MGNTNEGLLPAIKDVRPGKTCNHQCCPSQSYLSGLLQSKLGAGKQQCYFQAIGRQISSNSTMLITGRVITQEVDTTSCSSKVQGCSRPLGGPLTLLRRHPIVLQRADRTKSHARGVASALVPPSTNQKLICSPPSEPAFSAAPVSQQSMSAPLLLTLKKACVTTYRWACTERSVLCCLAEYRAAQGGHAALQARWPSVCHRDPIPSRQADHR